MRLRVSTAERGKSPFLIDIVVRFRFIFVKEDPHFETDLFAGYVAIGVADPVKADEGKPLVPIEIDGVHVAGLRFQNQRATSDRSGAILCEGQ